MRLLAGLHAGYLVVTGIWPLVHRASFERVTVWAGRNKSRAYFADLVPQAVFAPAWLRPWPGERA